MRIAISGTHFSGKSSLIASLLKLFPNYTSIQEPYYLLEEEGYEFLEPPSLEDFEEQSARSVKAIQESKGNTFFDRCPLDFLAYAEVLMEEEVFIDDWIQEMKPAIDRLDLIIFVPIEEKDRILVPQSQDKPLRKKVDQKLQEFLLEDSLGILEDVDVLEVVGSLERRVQIIQDYLSERTK